jgi:glycosyltransferase involved in cell wall biosynthesis
LVSEPAPKRKDDRLFQDEALLALIEETGRLRGENPLLKERLVELEQRHQALVDEIDRIQLSLGWAIVQRAHKLRRRLFRDGRLSGKCWNAFARLVRVAATSGTKAAIRRALRKFELKLDASGLRADAPVSGSLSRPHIAPAPEVRLEQLGWTFTGGRPGGHRATPGHFKVLLVSHTASRTGAPLCLLRVATELSKLPDLECWIVLQSGGELAVEFARVAPTLDVGQLVDQGVPRAKAPLLIASTFRACASRGMAICNTMAVSEFHAAFAHERIPVLSWVHELPTMVHTFGGAPAVARIKDASARIIVPSNAVREAWIDQFGVDASRIDTVYNGMDARTRGLDRQQIRSRVRNELGLPPDARIVLGCGTIDLRKGADLFVQVARRVLKGPHGRDIAGRTWFVWVGACDEHTLRPWLLHDVAVDGLEDRIIFTGQRADTAPYFLAADVYALPSREDPCPVANVEAMESGLPVVAFANAGGAPEVLRVAGSVVPYLDVAAMASEVTRLLRDPAVAKRMGQIAQSFVREHLTWSRFLDRLLEVLKDSYGYRTRRKLAVSVIVPNYCHARYLEDRLQSIFAQTLQPHEIIVLDDASTDDSVAVARELAQRSSVPLRIVVNDQNSGSTFRQWIKGLTLACGDLVWIAESDDSCDPEFLERLVPEFYDPEVVLAYSQSALIGPEGEMISPDFLDHTNDISTTRWRSRYCVAGAEEVELALSQKNTIPNASAALFRHPGRLDFALELAQLRFGGDLLFYAMLLRGGKIAYLPNVLNHYRRHERTVSHHAIRGDVHVEETLRVKSRVMESFPVSVPAIARSLKQSVSEYHWLNEHFGLERPPLSSNPIAAPWLDRIGQILQERLAPISAVRILVLLEDMELEAATVAHVQLANSLAREHIVYLCNAQPGLCDRRTIAMVDPRVILLEGCGDSTAWSEPQGPAADRLEYSGERRLRILKDLIRVHKIDVIHSCSEFTDGLVHQINDSCAVAGASRSARTAG